MPTPQTTKHENFRSILEDIAKRKGSLVSVFGDFAAMGACALAVQTREDEYLQIARSYTKDELGQFSYALGALVLEMQSRPYTDLLGVYYCEIQSKFTRDHGGEFYTPQEIGKLMAKISVNAKTVIAEGKPVTINDPASGSGGLILSVAEEFAEAKTVDLIRATCRDISKCACDMAYINMTLWGIPARIIWGDTLRNTINNQWENIHWHRVGEPMREQWNAFSRIMQHPEETSVQSKHDAKTNRSERDLQMQTSAAGQQEWIFD